jgi:glutathione S-transferase
MPRCRAGLTHLTWKYGSARHNSALGIMSKFVESGPVKMRGTLERLEARQADEVIAGPIIGFSEPFSDAGAAARQETINRCVALIGIAHLHFAQRQHAVGQAFTLVDIEHGVFPHHGNDARFAFIAVSVGDL